MRALKGLLTLFLFTALISMTLRTGAAQSLTTGSVEGHIVDQSGASVPNAEVVLTNTETGAVQRQTANSSGEYRFNLLKPGHYKVTVQHPGFEKFERPVEVPVGQVVTTDINLTVGQTNMTIEVSTEAALVSTEPQQSTNYSQTQIETLPSAGGDITNIAETAPGVVVNNMGGTGNFTANGLPGTSNLFTINGENDMDPYFNINNSGATNLTLGQNEIQEATISTQPYSGQFGQFAGAQVTYLTKSGSNNFHGNLEYFWNGRAMNSNDWFNNYYGNPRPFSNQNQWAGSVGGPIFKNRTFFFVDTEGLRFVLPVVDTVTVPTPAFASAVLANVTKLQPVEAPTYQKMFNLWANVPNIGSAKPVADSCGPTDPNTNLPTLSVPGFDSSSGVCAERFTTSPSAKSSEWILAFRIDHRISDKDSVYFRYKQDRGTQPTTIDAINPAFDAISSQPSWDTQVDETHVFGPRATNDFKATLSYYFALFEQNQKLAESTFPYDIITSGSVPFSGFNSLRAFPQGRNVTQYQFIDDFTFLNGKHSLKFGENYRRYDVSDHNFFYNQPAIYFGYNNAGLQNFADGLAFQYRRSLNLAADVPVAMWGLGVYGMDEWAVRPNLKLTLSLRAERNSNPVCNFNCFANFKGAFNSLPSYTAADPTTVPYSSDIVYNQKRAFPGVDAVDLSPRFGFSWSPSAAHDKTVLTGGFGIFYDAFPAGLVDDLLSNPPVSVAIRVRPSAGVLPFDPSGGALTWQESANAFNINKTYSNISAGMAALGAKFSPPAVTAIVGTMKAPEWQEWNIQLQQQLGGSYVLVLNYAGNHGVKIPYTNSWGNAYDPYGIFTNVPGIASSIPVPNYGIVTQVQNGAVSNYNGLTVSLRKQFVNGLAFHANYTWSHTIDEVSNGGIFGFGGESILGQNNPVSLYAANYASADYDIRHNFNADLTYAPKHKFSNWFVNGALGGWVWGMKMWLRSGLPFTVTDNNFTFPTYNGTFIATALPGSPAQTGSCGESAATTACLNANQFLWTGSSSFNGYTSFPAGARNQFRGPGYWNTDMSLFKGFTIREGVKLAVGAQAFNVFNHPNFGLPDSGLADGSSFGQVFGLVGTPTSPYGTGLGFDSSVRVVQLSARINF